MLNEHSYVTAWAFDCPIGSDQYTERVREIVEDSRFQACFASYIPKPEAETITVFGCISAQLKYFPTKFSEEILRKEIPEWIKFLGELGFEYPNLKFDFPKYGDDTFVAIQFDYGHMCSFSWNEVKGHQAYLILLRFIWENFGVRLWTSRLQRDVKTKHTKLKAKMILFWAEEINSIAMEFWQKHTRPQLVLKTLHHCWACSGHFFYGPFGRTPTASAAISLDDLKTDLVNLALTMNQHYALYNTLGRNLLGGSMKVISSTTPYKSILKDVKQYFVKMEKKIVS